MKKIFALLLCAPLTLLSGPRPECSVTVTPPTATPALKDWYALTDSGKPVKIFSDYKKATVVAQVGKKKLTIATIETFSDAQTTVRRMKPNAIGLNVLHRFLDEFIMLQAIAGAPKDAWVDNLRAYLSGQCAIGILGLQAAIDQMTGTVMGADVMAKQSDDIRKAYEKAGQKTIAQPDRALADGTFDNHTISTLAIAFQEALEKH